MKVPLVDLPYYDQYPGGVKAAAADYGVSGETIRRHCDKYGIGYRPKGPGWRDWAYVVSEPALRMVMAKDYKALEAFRRGDRTSDLVARHFKANVEVS